MLSSQMLLFACTQLHRHADDGESADSVGWKQRWWRDSTGMWWSHEISWSGPWNLVCPLEVFHVHSYQDQFIQHGLAECFCVFSLGLYFVYSFVFLWFVCVTPSFYVYLSNSVISLTVFGTSVTNLNEPPRAFSCLHYSVGYEPVPSLWAVVNKSKAG